MLLYHASSVEVQSPDVLHSRDNLDFGKGFYLTSLNEQALNYAQRFKRRGKSAWLNVYEFNYVADNWKTLEFKDYDGDWLDFISQCRNGVDSTSYDIVIGGVANDKVIITLDRYFTGELTKEQALGQLIYEKPNIQYCIRTQTMLDSCLRFIESLKL